MPEVTLFYSLYVFVSHPHNGSTSWYLINVFRYVLNAFFNFFNVLKRFNVYTFFQRLHLRI